MKNPFLTFDEYYYCYKDSVFKKTNNQTSININYISSFSILDENITTVSMSNGHVKYIGVNNLEEHIMYFYKK